MSSIVWVVVFENLVQQLPGLLELFRRPCTSRQAPSDCYRWFIFTKLMQVLTLVDVAEHYRDNIAYRDNLLNIIEPYRDITFSTIAHP